NVTSIKCRDSTSPEIINNHIIFHFPEGTGAPGGTGVFVYESSSPVIKNNIFYSNQQNDWGPDGISCQSLTAMIGYNDFFGFAENFTQCGSCIEDLTGVDGNISEDPLFYDFENNDYSLNWGSPCIDAGDPESELDPDGTIADMGAYYFHQTSGCTDSTATNYNPDANVDDGSCCIELWGECYSIENTTELSLSDNDLTGSIPPEIGQLINLTHLSFQSTGLTGSIPPEIGQLINLTYLHLEENP
ncbi:uncharacterized protein METZ01_LOCUS475632, partial [marine metagenome]